MKIRSISEQYTEIDGITVELSCQPSWIMDGHQEPVTERDGNILVVGYLVDDHDASNPLDDCDGMGRIYSAHRHSRTHSEMQNSLALDSDWSPDLSKVDAASEAVLLQEVSHGKFRADLVGYIMECANEGMSRNAAIDAFLDDFTGEHYGLWLSEKIKDTWMDWAKLREDRWRMAVEQGAIGNPYVVVLDVYDHGGQVWSVSGSGTQCAFDTASGAGVWVPDDYLTEELNTLRESSEGLVAARAKAREFARQCLGSYNAWLSGDCYGVVTDVFEIDAQGNAKRIHDDSVWGSVGQEHARSGMTDAAVGRAAWVLQQQGLKAA
jgi:hypothetical protein